MKDFVFDPSDCFLGGLRDAPRLHDVLFVDPGQPRVGLLPYLELLVKCPLLQR